MPTLPPTPFPADLLESYAPLEAFNGWLAHGFVRRIPGIDGSLDKAETLATLAPWHDAAAAQLGFAPDTLFTGEQIHAADLAVIDKSSPRHSLGVDGLVTATPGCLLAIHVADCAPVFLVDPVHRAIALLHSGRKSTEGHITARAIAAMQQHFGSDPQELTLLIGPCIRPPWFEIDIPALIGAEALAAGLPPNAIHDTGVCTHASPPHLYYSYRREKGRTGRMVALMGIRSDLTPETGPAT